MSCDNGLYGLTERAYSMRSTILYSSLAVALVGGLVAPSPSRAQDGSAAASNQAPAGEGEVIYSREVSNRSVGLDYTPGRAHSVVTGPTAILLDSMTSGLEPISDNENASITGAVAPQMDVIGTSLAQGLGAVNGPSGAQHDAATLAAMQGSATGGAIGTATNALTGALGSLRNVLGGRP